MQITRVEAWRVQLKLSEPYTIAYETVVSATNIFVRLHTNGPFVGHGVAAPDIPVTGETPDDVLTAMAAVDDALKGLELVQPVSVFNRARKEIGWRPSTLAAIDVAILDLFGQQAGVPLWKYLGGKRECIRTSVTIGILDEEQTIEQARRWLVQGFRSLKLKGGRDVQSDIARVRKVREAVGHDVELSFDGNQGYTFADARKFVQGCADVGLAYLEQPTPDNLNEVQAASPIPIMADENLKTLDDALDLVGKVPLFNVKLQKVGGIHLALLIAGAVPPAGGGLMVGCLDECALSIAAGLHFALARPEVRFADLDSHFTMLNDPSEGAVVFRDGSLHPTDRPGVGWVLL